MALKHGSGEPADSDTKLATEINTVNVSARTMHGEVVTFIIAKCAAEVSEAVSTLKPWTGGVQDGSWKDGLESTATIDEVKAHAAKTLLSSDGAAILSKWTDAKKALDKLVKLLQTYKDDVSSDAHKDRCCMLE